MTVKITNEQGEELWNFEGQTSATGFFEGRRLVPTDTRLMGRYIGEITANDGESTVTENWIITVQKRAASGRTQSLNQVTI